MKCNLENRADGISDIEGRIARVATREFGNDRVSNQINSVDRAVDLRWYYDRCARVWNPRLNALR